MKIMFATSEMAPLAKTGGLADVCGALPKALAARGHDVAVAMPFYGSIDREALDAELVLPEVIIYLPAGNRALSVWRATLPGSDEGNPVTVYLIDDPGLFHRPGLYGEGGRDYPDNPLRFAYFNLVTLWMLKGIGWMPEVLLCNDWQTALIPTYLQRYEALKNDPMLCGLPTVMAIHNMSFQGIAPDYLIEQLGLPRWAYMQGDLEFHGSLNLVKGAIIYSHAITTVSRTYAKEIQTPELGCGLEGVLGANKDKLTGILNGIDTEVWNPETDPHLAAPFSLKKPAGKKACKKDLQKRMGLPEKAATPLMGIITRLTVQKGLDLLAESLPELLKGDVQLVLLGTGQPEFHQYFEDLAREFPKKVAIKLDFDEALAHQIEAGTDMFLMPSRFEPCGLNQLYSLRYGTIPIVRRTGGLADSIVNATPKALAEGKATGFQFTPYEAKALTNTIRRALKLYRNDKPAWAGLMKAAMEQDFGWDASAQRYERLLKKVVREAQTCEV